MIRNPARSSEQVILRLNDQNLEHHHNIVGCPPAFGPVAVIYPRGELRTKHLKINRWTVYFKLITNVAQATKTLIKIKKSCPLHD